MIWFIVGLVVGSLLGFFCYGLMAANALDRREDE